ncbi:MAG TPA: substrate-binding domain-containing protein [Polyangiaceae bacterium]|jgi:quinoprotein dehydrogenase-associated probable ABC transporter substrate-binding protein|nr:substrate-binding domain-containing protein [Polyangiaceae bacterium]
MSSGSERLRLPSLVALTVLSVLALAAGSPDERRAEPIVPPPDELRICSDPNNLPFSNARGEGFENRLADILAKELGKKRVTYKFFPERRGFIRNTLKAGFCDVVMGVPVSYELAQTTVPYYRSTYVFVTRRDAGPAIRSFDDPRLHSLAIGIHVIGDDYSNVPPAEALARRGIVDNIHGYPVYGPYSEPDPPRKLIDAVARGDVDVAIAWGPLAGYFARTATVPLVVTPVSPASSTGPLAMTFDISLGVRRGDDALRKSLEQALTRRRKDVRKLLESYGVPLLDAPARGARGATEEH